MRIAPLLMVCGQAFGTPVPYEPDARTLHLWHLDEAAAPFADHGRNPVPLLGLHNGARAGSEALPGLGHGVSFHHHAGGTPGDSSLRGAILTAAPRLANGPADRAPAGFRIQGEDGAFTLEALLRFDALPEDAEGIALAILTMDGEGGERVFSFRIEREGFLAFTPLWDAGSDGGALASIPREGPHALNTGDWFHVAVTYDGREGTPGNLKLYWTNTARAEDEAVRIGTGTLSEDLAPVPGDFAIGNEARSYDAGNAEAEPFPGLIDEVRISSTARHPTDFLFVAPEKRHTPANGFPAQPDPLASGPLRLGLAGVLVDGKPLDAPLRPGAPLSLKPGQHRIDFDYEARSADSGPPPQTRCRLEGFDDRWQPGGTGMSLIFEFLDPERRSIAQTQFDVSGSSPGWGSQITDSPLRPRTEALYAPEGAAFLRVTLSSGSPDTTGRFAIDDLDVLLPENGGRLWERGNFEPDDGSHEGYQSPTRAPAGWQRGGDEPAIALVAHNGRSWVLGLIDGDQSRTGLWSAVQPLDTRLVGGHTLVASWNECFNVIRGSQQRATYLKVPPGEYVFRVIGLSEGLNRRAANLSLPLEIRRPVWERPWFWPAVSGFSVLAAATAVLRHLRRRARRRMREMAFQNALEKNRIRIARDMHDDLGTRVTVLNLTASQVNRELESNPGNARRHLEKLMHAARGLVVAMDELVWTVDPSHDNLDDLLTQLTRHAEEVFQDSDIRCRLDIPASLPAVPLRSDFRHNISMAVRESLHNILKHAGPCEALLRVRLDGGELAIDIQDSGRGFEPDAAPGGNGLPNIASRMAEIGGCSGIESSPGAGTRVILRCGIPASAPRVSS